MMAFRTSRLYKALDKHEATTPKQIRDLVAEGEDAQMVDSATGRGYIHKIVELFEAPQEDEYLESQLIPSLVCLIGAGADVNHRDMDGNTPLHLAFILNSGWKVLSMLLKLGADVTILNDREQKMGDLINNNTDPLMVKTLGVLVPGLWHAVESEDHTKVVYLLQKWSRIDIYVDGKSLIERAKEIGNSAIIASLQEYWPANQFIYSCYLEDTRKMKKILKKEKLNLEMKDTSCIDDDGNPAEITLLGECLMLNIFESAQFLLEKGAFVNEPIQVGDEKEPLFFHLMKNNPSLMYTSMFNTLIDRADLKLIKKFSVGVLYTGFTNRWPVEVVQKLIENGLDITTRSEEGYTVRDNLLVQVAFYPRKKRLEKLHYVDQHIVNLVIEGETEKLKDMALSGYTSLNIFDKKGRPTAYLAKKAGHKELADWLEGIGDTFKASASLMEYIRQANLAKAREYLTEMTAFMRDRSGRSPLHMATLYERRFVIKYLVKSYPASVHIKDDHGRTALHYACALPEATDIEDLLAKHGADDTTQDDNGRCPMDYKIHEDENFIESEKNKTCSHNIYLLEVYLNFADGIIEDDFDLVRDTRDDLYEDIKMADIIPGMYKSTTEQPPSFLQLCIDNRRENIARYLIKNGVDMWQDVTLDGQAMKFPVAVEKAGMMRLHEFLAKKRREDAEEEAKFKEAEENIKKLGPKSDDVEKGAIESRSDADAKSKSCAIL